MRKPPRDWELHKRLVGVSQNSYTVSHLKCATNYQFYVESFNDAGISPGSDVVSIATAGTRKC